MLQRPQHEDKFGLAEFVSPVKTKSYRLYKEYRPGETEREREVAQNGSVQTQWRPRATCISGPVTQILRDWSYISAHDR